MRILIVDDSVSTRAVLKQMLADLGHNDVIEAADGIDAANMLQKNAVDLVISDWEMPHMDGVELVKAIRSRGDDVPVVIVVGQSKRCEAIGALQAGANSYIVKPFDSTTLSDRIMQAVKAREA